MQGNPRSWPQTQRLDTIMAAYRMTVLKVTGVTRTWQCWGVVLFPATLIAKPPEEATKPSTPFVTSLRDALRQAHERVRKATHSAAKTMTKGHRVTVSLKASWSGCCGPNQSNDSAFTNSRNNGTALEKFSPSKRPWWL